MNRRSTSLADILERAFMVATSLVFVTATPALASPPFETPPEVLDASLTCPVPLDAPGAPDPVLLVHGTAIDSSEYSWNYVPAFNQLGIPFCLVDLDAFGESDVQTNAERIVHAIQTMHAASGDLIDVVGHSQGGMIPRWAFLFWPEIRAMVDDHVGHAPSNHGTVLTQGVCADQCAEAEWQQDSESNFMGILNADRETFPQIDYTVVYTLTDEIVVPQIGPDASSPLRDDGSNVRNVALQDICPSNQNEHLAIGTYDPLAFALTMDALENPGPADPARIPLTICAETLMPGVDPITFAADYAGTLALLSNVQATKELAPAEPPLKAYTVPEPTFAAGLLGGFALVLSLRRERQQRTNRKTKRRV